MPASSSSSRLVGGLLAVVLLTAGCEAIGDAGQAIGRADLVNDLATRLDRAHELTYSAEYTLPDNQTATISHAQRPARAAYDYPGGKIIVTPDATTACDLTTTPPTCTLTLPPSPSNRPAVAVFREAGAKGLVTPPVVVNLLTAAALDTKASVEQSDTTIAGRHATCVTVNDLSNAAAAHFNACITTDGALGSFTGVVDGVPIDLTMSSYVERVDDSVFEAPQDARIIDKRPDT